MLVLDARNKALAGEAAVTTRQLEAGGGAGASAAAGAGGGNKGKRKRQGSS
jgi:hypothetical protein